MPYSQRLLLTFARFFRALVKPEPSTAGDAAGDPSRTGDENGDEKSVGRVAIHINFESLTKFQGVHGMAEQQQSKPVSSENFRKRPNYDGSRRKLFRLQRERQSQLIAQCVIVAFPDCFLLVKACKILVSELQSPITNRNLRHAQTGASRSRVERLASLDCCRCHRRICFSKFRNLIGELLKFLEVLWSMARATQDAFVSQLVSAINLIVIFV